MSRDTPASLRWAGSLALVLAAHALLIGGAVWWQQRAPVLVSDMPVEAVMVELAPVPEAPTAPPKEMPPGPLQQEQHRPEPTPVPKVDLPPDDTPDAQDVLRRETPREEEPTDQRNVEQTLAPPDVPARPSERYAATQTIAGRQGPAAVTWQGLLLGHLEQYRRYPRQAERLRQQGVAYVRFSVDRQGNASNIRLGQSSGHALLDEETLATVRRGSPLPPPPAEITGDPVEVMVPVTFFLRRR
ncbi:energy transducer TonB [Stenotrophomonas sp. SAM-B]|uniref:energy transducer TonB n=1 Tax=Stenotrophomonas sp. SAM-B TaxID=2729141 RepID=UPI0015A284AD|nr:energy transducer TonB [Stenotrophomonas sp. SAM-B]NWF32053.1 energy transducer TonB [Stenotrophomonas sp. SAM-B]